jgi:hypothetical protein
MTVNYSYIHVIVSQAIVSFKKYMPPPSKEEEGAYIFLNETSACAFIVWEN